MIRYLIIFIVVILAFTGCEIIPSKSNARENVSYGTILICIEDNVPLTFLYLSFKGDSIERFIEYPSYFDSLTSKNVFKISSVPFGEYQLKINSFFGYEYNKKIKLFNDTLIVNLKYDMFKVYAESIDIVSFVDEIKSADTIRFYQKDAGCIGSSEKFFYILMKDEKYESHEIQIFEDSAIEQVYINIPNDYKERIIDFIEYREKKTKKIKLLNSKRQHIYLSTSNTHLYLNVGNKYYEINTQMFNFDDENRNKFLKLTEELTPTNNVYMSCRIPL